VQKRLIAILFLAFAIELNAHDLPIQYNKKVSSAQKEILEKTFAEVALLMPRNLKDGLPLNIEISVEKISEGAVMPGDEICKKYTEEEAKQLAKNYKPRFVYGMYNRLSNSLHLNASVISELAKGRSLSQKITCQHGSLYDQSIATIIHELTHAYDSNQKSVSSSLEFLRNAGFKKGFLRTKTKNINAARSADPYELVNAAESFAVNMEYFTMDSEFACRKPALFNYYKNLLLADPFPSRACEINHTVMMSSSQGFQPVKLDLARVYRIDYLLAAAGNDLSSGFGHSMFRIVMCAPERYDFITKKQIAATPYGPKCLEDKLYHLVVSYRANVEDATLSYFKGIFGGYPSLLFILSFADVLDEYNKDELRDVVSYPLKLSLVEKTEFIEKVIEEHWNYRGSYKFFTNNCAVESEDLLKFSLGRQQLTTKSSYTPNGVLEDLDKIQMTQTKGMSVENYKAKTEQLIAAYKTAYGYQPRDAKKDKEAILKFVKTSSAEQRMDIFLKSLKLKKLNVDLHTELSILKENLVRSSSFSVIEQQVLRTTGSSFKKRAAELFLNSKDEALKNKMQEKTADIRINFKELSKDGYGIPLDDEVTSTDALSTKMQETKDVGLEFEKIARSLMPDDFKNLDDISANITKFNEQAIGIRKEYRNKLEGYIHQVIHNLTLDETTKNMLVSIQNGDTAKIKELRELLDVDLVSEREILDGKLVKFVTEELVKE
jgi:hypothetical protein